MFGGLVNRFLGSVKGSYTYHPFVGSARSSIPTHRNPGCLSRMCQRAGRSEVLSSGPQSGASLSIGNPLKLHIPLSGAYSLVLLFG